MKYSTSETSEYASTLDIRPEKKEREPAHSGPDTAPLSPVTRAFLDNLLRLNLVTAEAADRFLEKHADRVPEFHSAEAIGAALVAAGLLTQYQLERIMTGATYGLVLGHYRVLNRLGCGGMGIVFVGEHIQMQRKVAIKVLPVDDDCPAVVLERFYNEARALAQLN